MNHSIMLMFSNSEKIAVAPERKTFLHPIHIFIFTKHKSEKDKLFSGPENNYENLAFIYINCSLAFFIYFRSNYQ